MLFWPCQVKNLIYVIFICFAVFSSVPVEEQAEFKQLSDEIQELQQSLNQEFRQKTVSAVVLNLRIKEPVSLSAKMGFFGNSRELQFGTSKLQQNP